MSATRRGVIVGFGSAVIGSAVTPGVARTPSASTPRDPAPVSPPVPEALTLDGALVQGGYAVGRTRPGATVLLDGEALTQAASDGVFIVGFDRDAPSVSTIRILIGDAVIAERSLDVAPRTFRTSRIDGLPPATVTVEDPALLARIAEESALKAAAFDSRAAGEDFLDGFDWPLETYRISSPWGAQRVLNGTPARPHYGIDLAAPAGTPIRAPAAGTVVLARDGLHFEGGLTLIDHGQGLISAYLHQSRIDTVTGQRVERGQIIGRVGMSGRATGPHLCWRLRWRGRQMDPSLMTETAKS